MSDEETRCIDFEISTDDEEVYVRKKIKKSKLATYEISTTRTDFLYSNNTNVRVSLNDQQITEGCNKINEDKTGELLKKRYF